MSKDYKIFTEDYDYYGDEEERGQPEPDIADKIKEWLEKNWKAVAAGGAVGGAAVLGMSKLLGKKEKAKEQAEPITKVEHKQSEPKPTTKKEIDKVKLAATGVGIGAAAYGLHRLNKAFNILKLINRS